jgi:preprotein translocase subunit SecF
MSEHHRFRYLLPPGTNFAFVAKFKTWLVLSCVLMAASVGALFVNKSVHGEYMNWTIDFKGGTELHFSFKDKANGKYVKVDPGKIRDSLAKAGEDGFDVSSISWTATDKDGNDVTVDGMIVHTPRFSALSPEIQQRARDTFIKAFEKSKRIVKINWSGDRLNIHSLDPITQQEAADLFATIDTSVSGAKQPAAGKSNSLEVKPWTPEEEQQYTRADEGTKEYNQWFGIWGIDRQYEQIFESAVSPGGAACATNTSPSAGQCVDAITAQSYGVGAKAGSKLRDDAAKSIIYAIFLIMLYLAFRFDIRYAPGAAFATIHDAVMVIGVFAVTWTDVSLTSVAGLLTVMGYSVNDTVIVFDRIRENQAKLKDKKLERIIDISLNEMLVRTILTSSTVFATTLIMNIFGTGLVKNFAFAMNVGVIVGTYSSIFLATPIFMWVSKKWYSGPAPARRRPVAAAQSSGVTAVEGNE